MQTNWQVGVSRRVVTPTTDVWLAGYGWKRAPEGKIHEVWVKVLVLQPATGKRAVLITSDHMGMSHSIYESVAEKLRAKFGLERADFMLTFSHNHCGPCLRDDLVDYYPSDEAQLRLVAEYTDWMEGQLVEAVGEALSRLQPAELLMGEGTCSFAVNRRDNKEDEVPKLRAAGVPLKGAVDHAVPVLVARSATGASLAILFGYACHPTTLRFTQWCGDYPGFAQINLEASFPETTAMFFNACGGDQNPLPRLTVELAAHYGEMLSNAVRHVLRGPLRRVSSDLKTAFEFIELPYDELVTRETLLPALNLPKPASVRWAKRMLVQVDAGVQFQRSSPYPVQVWRIGRELLFIGIGGEAVVDYSLRFKREFGVGTWVCGYANEMLAYIPSRRVWEEGGYEGGPHLDEYGHPAFRWAGDVEDRIVAAVHRLAAEV